MSVYAIGDLHGCLDELEVLLDAIGARDEDRLVFLGDYVDRGPAIRALVERLVRLQEERPDSVFLRGNHEDMLLDYLGLPGGHFGTAYVANGGAPTLESYGVPRGMRGAEAAAFFPPAHLGFLQATTLFYQHDRFVFVHAGVRPGLPLADQAPEDLMWIREEFFTIPHALPYTVVFGHTPQRDARLGLPYFLGLDTGVVYGNKLSCFDVDGRRLLQVARGAHETVVTDLAPAFSSAGI